MHRAGRGDDVFLDHQAAHVVGAEEQGELADLQPLRHPRRLDVRDVVEIEPGDGLRLADTRTTRPAGDVGHGRVARAGTSSR